MVVYSNVDDSAQNYPGILMSDLSVVIGRVTFELRRICAATQCAPWAWAIAPPASSRAFF
jgi:hypothetical protein